jgi:hypothetical protein
MKSVLLFLIISMFCTYSNSQIIAATQDTINHKSNAVEFGSNNEIEFFASDEPLQLSLCFNIREFLKTRSRQEYCDARLTVKLNENDSISENIKIKARGIMRLSYCSFPPIMLKFKGDNQETSRTLGKGTIKLVTQCKWSSLYESYVFKEYLAYKLFSLVTPYSFKTRLVKINYVDIHETGKTYASYGFLIENDDKMAERNKAFIINNKNVLQKNMNTEDMARVAVFNYMIGNTDWSVPNQHNIKILKSLEIPSDKGIPVAYDFDYAGFVNTVYSLPAEGLPIEDVTERYYSGLCYSNEELNPVLDEFAGMKEKFLNTINGFEYLSAREKKKAETYIKSFYKMNDVQNILINSLNCTCKKF